MSSSNIFFFSSFFFNSLPSLVVLCQSISTTIRRRSRNGVSLCGPNKPNIEHKLALYLYICVCICVIESTIRLISWDGFVFNSMYSVNVYECNWMDGRCRLAMWCHYNQNETCRELIDRIEMKWTDQDDCRWYEKSNRPKWKQLNQINDRVQFNRPDHTERRRVKQ